MRVLDRVSMVLPVCEEVNDKTSEGLARDVFKAISEEFGRRFEECFAGTDGTGHDNDFCLNEMSYEIMHEIHEDAAP